MKLRVIVPSILLLAGCVVPTAGGAVAVMPPGAVVFAPAAHIHSTQCPHFWGYYSGRPVYHVGGQYIYWESDRWVALSKAPDPGLHRQSAKFPNQANASVPSQFWQ